MIGLALVLSVLATEPVPVHIPDPLTGAASALDDHPVEDIRARTLLVRLNLSRVEHLERGLALVDQTERHCTPAWADELLAVRAAWNVQADTLTTELKQPEGQWAPAPSDEAITAAQSQVQDALEQADAAFMERVKLMNQLMARCPEHREALQGIYALGKHSFIVG